MTSLKKGKLQIVLNQVPEGSQTVRNVRGGLGKLNILSDTKNDKAAVTGMEKSFSLSKKPESDQMNVKDLMGKTNALGESKGKCDIAANAKVRRKALADVSNMSINSSRKTIHGGLKPAGLVDPGFKAERNIQSRIPSMVKARQNSSTNLFTTKPGCKDTLAFLNEKSTQKKNKCRESGVTYGRTMESKLPIQTRQSLPAQLAVRRGNLSRSSNIQATTENLEKAKEISGVKVKAKFNKVVAQVSNTKSSIWKNRASDGVIIMGSKAKANVDSRASSRKIVRPIVKSTTVRTSGTQRKLESGCVLRKTKIISVSQKDEESISSSLPAPGFSDSHEVTQGEPSDDGKSEKTTKQTGVVGNKARRRSYTSLLMAAPKLLEECGGIIQQGKLPTIDDSCNQLEVVQYIDEIYQFYWVTEAQNSSLQNYMSIQTDITSQMRGILVNWLIEVHLRFDLMPETLYLTVTLLDQYLSQVKISKSELQLVGLTAVLLASKYEDFWHPRVKDLLSIAVETYTRTQMLGMEKLILKQLKFRLNTATPYVFMLRFLKAAQSDNKKLEHLAFYLIDLCLVEYEALNFKPSLLCASAVYVARCTLQESPAWTPLLIKHARYDASQIRECAEMILRFQKAARTGKLSVTYEKYLRRELSSAATIKPLDKLPL